MPRLALLAVLALPPPAVPPPAVPSQAPAPRVELVPLGDRVWAAVRREPLGLAQNANSLVVAGDSAMLVVDAQFTREATRETMAAVRAATPLPVRWIVNTHWHDDHVAGNQVWRDSFPDVRVAMHAATRADLLGVARENRAREVAGGPAAMGARDRDRARRTRRGYDDARPEPPCFLPPPSCLLTVAHARRSASSGGTPCFSYPSSMCSAFRFCLSVYVDLSPCDIAASRGWGSRVEAQATGRRGP